jgi:hypothetical protein
VQLNLAYLIKEAIFAPLKLTAEVAQLVEHQLPKLRVAGSNPVFRSKKAAFAAFTLFGFLRKRVLTRWNDCANINFVEPNGAFAGFVL